MAASSSGSGMSGHQHGIKRTAAESFGPCVEDNSCKVDLRRPEHPQDGFFWITSYQERAFLTKVKVPTRRVRSTAAPIVCDLAVPTELKFITNPPDHPTAGKKVGDVPTYCLQHDAIDMEQSLFEAKVKEACGDAFDFDLSVNGEGWDNAFSIIKGKDFSFSESSQSWMSPKPALLPSQGNDTCKDLYRMSQSLERALLVNMSNGEAKKFIGYLLTSIENHSNVDDVLVDHESPVRHSHTNGRIQFVDPNDVSTWRDDSQNYEELKLKDMLKASSSISDSGIDELNICDSTVRRKVPDHIWYLHQYPGYFVLNVEFTQVPDYSARIQCIYQMLTQLHFQASVFGLVISKKNWTLIVIYKRGDRLSVNQISRSLINRKGNFDVENFKFLCSWLYRILDYRLKCLAG